MTSDVGRGAPFVALADQGDKGVAFVLDPSTGAIRGRVDIGGTPDAVVDWNGGRLLLFCSIAGAAHLVAYDIASLRELWSIPVLDRHMTKAPGGLPAIAVGSDGRFAFVLHYTVLRPGDANAPGASVVWLTSHDLRTGAQRARVDFPDCGAGRVLAGGGDLAYVICRRELHAIDTATWAVTRRFFVDDSVQPVGIFADRAIYGVTRDLRVLALDLNTGDITPICCKTTGTSATAQGWGRLAIGPGGLSLWVIAKASGERNEFGPDTLAAFNLRGVSSVFEIPVPGLRGVGLVGSRVVYGTGGSLRSTDGAIDEALIDGRVEYWHILANPASN